MSKNAYLSEDSQDFQRRRSEMLVALLCVFLLICATSQAASVPGKEAPSQVTWQRLTTPTNRALITGVTVLPSNSAILFVGLDSGEIYRSDSGGVTWQRVKGGAVPRDFLRSLARADEQFLRRLPSLSEAELQRLLGKITEKKKGEVDVTELDYDDLEFEDFDLQSVDVSDVEFRDDRDPDSVDLTEAEEEDIDRIDITDESYLRNPDEVKERFAQERGPEPGEKSGLSPRTIKKLLFDQRKAFLAIRQMAVVSEGEQTWVIVLTPMTVFRSADLGATWERVVEARWEQGERFLRMAFSDGGGLPGAVVSTSRVFVFKSFRESPITITHGLTPNTIQDVAVMSAPRKAVVVQTSTSLQQWLINMPTEAGTVPHRVLLQPAPIGKMKRLLVQRGGRLLALGSQGLASSMDGGRSWTVMPFVGVRIREPRAIIPLTQRPDWFLLVQAEKVFVTFNGGRSVSALPLPVGSGAVVDVAVRSPSSRQISLYAITARHLFRLPLVESGRMFKGLKALPPLSRLEVTPEKPKAKPVELHFPSYSQVLGSAARKGLWEVKQYEQWRHRLRLASLFPEVRLNINYYDLSNNVVRFQDQMVNLHTDPDYYSTGPGEHTFTDYQYQYFAATIYFRWNLNRLFFSKDMLSIGKQTKASYKRRKKLERKLKVLYNDRVSLEFNGIQAAPTVSQNPMGTVEQEIRRQELDALLDYYCGPLFRGIRNE